MAEHPSENTVQLDAGCTAAVRDQTDPLLALARTAISAHLGGQPVMTDGGPPSQPVFVTLWTGPEGGERARHLRGCVGRMTPEHGDLHREVASCAVAAATRDPRFDPVQQDELDRLVVEISILGPEEPVHDRSALDPLHYGVVVRQGARAGVLLPGVEGVTTADEQVRIAMQKGRIDPASPFALTRFEVKKLKEAPRRALEVV